MNLGLNAIERTHGKHEEWRIRLKKSVEDFNVATLTDECKWLLYWHQKLLFQDPEKYQKVEQDIANLIKKAGVPFITTSVNYSGKKPARNIKDIPKGINEIESLIYGRT